MDLGAFSISLAVKDLEASRKFYEKFGFTVSGGDASQNWLILKNGDHVIGLFHGMFEKNILTFNPGWDQNAQKYAPSPTFVIAAQAEGRAFRFRRRQTSKRLGQPASSPWTRTGIRSWSINMFDRS